MDDWKRRNGWVGGWVGGLTCDDDGTGAIVGKVHAFAHLLLERVGGWVGGWIGWVGKR